MSLDAVMESPEKWQLPYFDDEMGEVIGAAISVDQDVQPPILTGH